MFLLILYSLCHILSILGYVFCAFYGMKTTNNSIFYPKTGFVTACSVSQAIHDHKKTPTQGRWGSRVFAESEDTEACHLQASLTCLRSVCGPAHLRCKCLFRIASNPYHRKRPTTRVGLFLWWGKLDSDQRSQ